MKAVPAPSAQPLRPFVGHRSEQRFEGTWGVGITQAIAGRRRGILPGEPFVTNRQEQANQQTAQGKQPQANESWSKLGTANWPSPFTSVHKVQSILMSADAAHMHDPR